MEAFRDLSEQVLELVRDVVAGMVPCTVSELFGNLSISPETLNLPFLDDAPDLPTARIILDADGNVSKAFPAQKTDTFLGKIPRPIQNVLGLGVKDNGVIEVSHGQNN